MRRTFVLSTCLVFIMAFAASPVLADSVSAFSSMSATANAGTILSVTYLGQDYTVADETLIAGQTTKYNDDDEAISLTGDAYPSEDADDFDLSTCASNGSGNDSANNMVYLNTIFDVQSSAFFIFENGGNDDGTIQAVDASGDLIRTSVPFDSSHFGQVLYNGSNLRSGIGGQNVMGMLFKTDVPVWGFRITDADTTGMDAISNSAAVPIPGAIWLLGSGVVGLLAFRRRARN